MRLRWFLAAYGLSWRGGRCIACGRKRIGEKGGESGAVNWEGGMGEGAGGIMKIMHKN